MEAMYGTNVILNSFVRRQTIDSPYTDWSITDEALINRVHATLECGNAKPGYREGVLVVPVAPQGIYTSLTTLKEGDELVGTFKARREGEFPRKSITKPAGEDWCKPEAKAVDVILYASTTLAEDGSNELPAIEGNWEIISVNGRPTEEEAPIAPMTLIYNHFHVDGSNDGGSSTGMTDKEFVEALRISHEYWKDKAFIG
jgi:hypothetical protein